MDTTLLLFDMSNCLYPRTRSYVDQFTNTVRFSTYPCGKCVNCLEAKRKEWEIRLFETLSRQPDFIYDTWTFRPSSLPTVDVSDLKYSSVSVIVASRHTVNLDFEPGFSDTYVCPESSEEFFLYPDTYRLLDHYDWQVPYVEKKLVTDFMHRAIARYYSFYRKQIRSGKVKPHFKYFLVLEYGPKWSRPHLHLVFTGLRYYGYLKFFCDPWRQEYGFTKPRYIRNSSDSDAASKVASYISKYINKGDFESPLVRDGIAPRSFRVISHGIGEELLQDQRYGYLFSPFRLFLRSVNYDGTSNPYLVNEARKYVTENQIFDKHDLFLLTSYCSPSGFVAALPRYYRYKVLHMQSRNFFAGVAQTGIYEMSLDCDYKSISKFANARFGSGVGEKLSSAFFARPASRLASLLFYEYALDKRRKASLVAEGNQVKLKNFVTRPMRDLGHDPYTL